MEKPKDKPWLYGAFVVLGLVLIAGLVALLMDVMDSHVKRAQSISRSASWQGKPVGVMEQANVSPSATSAATAPSQGFMPVNSMSASAP